MPFPVSDQGLADTAARFQRIRSDVTAPSDYEPGVDSGPERSVTRLLAGVPGNGVVPHGDAASASARRISQEQITHALDRLPMPALLLDCRGGSVVGANAHYWHLIERPRPSGEAEMRGHFELFGDFYQICDVDGRPLPYREWPVQCVLHGEGFAERRLFVRHRVSGRGWLLAYRCRFLEERPSLALMTMDRVAAGSAPGSAVETDAQRLLVFPPETEPWSCEIVGEMVGRGVRCADWVLEPVTLCSPLADVRDEDFLSGGQIVYVRASGSNRESFWT